MIRVPQGQRARRVIPGIPDQRARRGTQGQWESKGTQGRKGQRARRAISGIPDQRACKAIQGQWAQQDRREKGSRAGL